MHYESGAVEYLRLSKPQPSADVGADAAYVVEHIAGAASGRVGGAG